MKTKIGKGLMFITMSLICIGIIWFTVAQIHHFMEHDTEVIKSMSNKGLSHKLEVKQIEKSYYSYLLMVQGKIKCKENKVKTISGKEMERYFKKMVKDRMAIKTIDRNEKIVEIISSYCCKGIIPIIDNWRVKDISAELYHYKDAILGRCECNVWNITLENSDQKVHLVIDADNFFLYQMDAEIKRKIVNPLYKAKQGSGLTESDLEFIFGGFAVDGHPYAEYHTQIKGADSSISEVACSEDRIFRRINKNEYKVTEKLQHSYVYYIHSRFEDNKASIHIDSKEGLVEVD